ncbi:hypothetical protein NPIL_131831 [Nephila pilipes]|uniref:Uncharacterized protein n=1 Tax=Nephila pilipes TaxID=299642 RepID=A0A8X6QFX1_NEPPI|nr:hypothetical protein NPIL_131831 [Nephila pilipes]
MFHLNIAEAYRGKIGGADYPGILIREGSQCEDSEKYKCFGIHFRGFYAKMIYSFYTHDIHLTLTSTLYSSMFVQKLEEVYIEGSGCSYGSPRASDRGRGPFE